MEGVLLRSRGLLLTVPGIAVSTNFTIHIFSPYFCLPLILFRIYEAFLDLEVYYTTPQEEQSYSRAI